jgi:hypothetical protein
LKRAKSALVLIVLAVVAVGVYWYYVPPSSTNQVTTSSPQTSTATSAVSLPPTHFYYAGSSSCLAQNKTTGGNLAYLVGLHITTDLIPPINYSTVVVRYDALTLSNIGKVKLLGGPPVWADSSWTAHGANLSVYVWLTVNGSLIGYPHDKIIGADLTVAVYAYESGQLVGFNVSPILITIDLSDVSNDCS